MTALVACLGLLPAALSTGIGSDTQRRFAIVIVAGLISRLFIGFFVNPVLYENEETPELAAALRACALPAQPRTLAMKGPKVRLNCKR